MPKGKRKNKINLFQEIIINNKVAKNKKNSKIIGINNFPISYNSSMWQIAESEGIHGI